MTEPRSFEVELRGPAGEPVDLWRTLISHGIASLAPARIDEAARTHETTIGVDGGRPRTIVITEGSAGRAKVTVSGRAPSIRAAALIRATVRRMLALDRDLSHFYGIARSDPDLAWAASGAGRMMRSPSVFQDVVKTVCTTNCSWAATVRMVAALVEHLGEPAGGAPPGPHGRAFPTAEAMAAQSPQFYKEVVRAGYRGPYLASLAGSVAAGEVDLEALADPRNPASDDDVERALLALPGIGPYAAAHVMLILGRHSRLILDSWTRPKYARLSGKKTVSDAAILRRWGRYGRHAGLAFWLFVTSDWVDD